MSGTVYLIRNKINKKVYIGQTVKPIQQRFNEHRYNHKSKANKPLYRAILKYGLDAFEFIVLDTNIESQKELDKAEIRQIKAHNSLSPNGYNLKEGGANAPKMPSLPDSKLPEFLRIEPNKSLGYIAGHFGVSVRSVQNFVKRHNIKRKSFRRKDKTREINYDVFMNMYASNMLVSEIAFLLEVSQSKIYTYIKEHNISKRYKKSSNT